MSGVPFDEEKVQQELVKILTEMVGDQMGFLITPDGTVTNIPAIYLTEQNIPQATLPFLAVSFVLSNDSSGFMLDSGFVEEPDPDNPPLLIGYPFYDTYLHYIISLRCEGAGSGKILRDVRRQLLTPKYRLQVNTNMFSSTQLIAPVIKNSDLLATEYRQAHTTILRFDTVDRVIDYSAGVFDQILYEGLIYRDCDGEDPDPIVINPSTMLLLQLESPTNGIISDITVTIGSEVFPLLSNTKRYLNKLNI